MGDQSSLDNLLREAREILGDYGRDYAIGALRGLAVRNMIKVSLPGLTDGFYPIVKVHEMALRELEDLYYGYLQERQSDDGEDLLRMMVQERVWE